MTSAHRAIHRKTLKCFSPISNFTVILSVNVLRAVLISFINLKDIKIQYVLLLQRYK